MLVEKNGLDIAQGILVEAAPRLAGKGGILTAGSTKGGPPGDTAPGTS